MAGSFRSNHDDTNSAWSLDQSKVNCKTMSKKQCFPLGKVGLNFIFINLSLLHVRNTDHDNISLGNRFSDLHYFETMTLCHPNGFTSLVQSNDYLATTLL